MTLPAESSANPQPIGPNLNARPDWAQDLFTDTSAFNLDETLHRVMQLAADMCDAEFEHCRCFSPRRHGPAFRARGHVGGDGPRHRQAAAQRRSARLPKVNPRPRGSRTLPAIRRRKVSPRTTRRWTPCSRCRSWLTIGCTRTCCSARNGRGIQPGRRGQGRMVGDGGRFGHRNGELVTHAEKLRDLDEVVGVVQAWRSRVPRRPT